MLRWIGRSFAVLLLTACASLGGKQADLHPKTLISGGTLTALQEAYDVRHYTLRLRVDPHRKHIAGTLAVRVEALSPLDVVELDLDPRFVLGPADHDGRPLTVERDANKVRLHLSEALAAGETATLSLSYRGQPYVAENAPWDGGFVWSETKDGHPWIATAVQGRGCDLWWPCKDHYGDKPDEGLDLIITVPEPLVVAMNGVLVDETHTDGEATYHWRSSSPHTGYAVALNIGPYTVIEDVFPSRDGSLIPIAFYALPENADKARALIETDAKPHLQFFEDLVGPYPWREEKVGFVETPHLGMEHQTINAYGWGYKKDEHGFDWLLHHELSHEWFGNAMTHANPEDMWLHEGYGMYMQPLYTEATLGEAAYRHHMYDLYLGLENCQPPVVPDTPHVEAAISNRDVYNKGAWTLHTLRWLVGDEALWRATRRLVYGTTEPWEGHDGFPGYRSTEDFIAILSEEAGRDLGGVIHTYLFQAELPVLSEELSNGKLTLVWEGAADGFDLPVPVVLDGQPVTVAMEDGRGQLAVPEGAAFDIDPNMLILRALPIGKSCKISG
ncbi:MAG: M1 family metallopeptidase [Pseudomonadota bacterium]